MLHRGRLGDLLRSGGSLDESFASDKLQAVLIKTGPGRLSPQLLMGYTSSLRDG